MMAVDYQKADKIWDAYRDKFGSLTERLGAGYIGTWTSTEEMLSQLQKALKSGIPVKLVKKTLEVHSNPYAISKEKNEINGAELYDYWEKFHLKFPIGDDGYTDSEIISRLIKKALKENKPVKSPTISANIMP